MYSGACGWADRGSAAAYDARVEPDLAFLRGQTRPDYESGDRHLVAVDLFAGCGGLSIGLAEACRGAGVAFDLALAVEFDEAIARVLGVNFPKANIEPHPVESFFDGDLGVRLTRNESRIRERLGRVHWLHGGPPCQGHSDLNNSTRRNDPRNAFYLRMVRAAEVLQPPVLLIENVPGVQHDVGAVVGQAREHLAALGYSASDAVLPLNGIGVPQRRKRHTLLALRGIGADPANVLGSVTYSSADRDLEWAIGDLIAGPRDPLSVASTTSSDNAERIAYLHDRDEYDLPNALRPDCHQGEHSYRSMYGRLSWTEPAQTITSGFGSMGQGRYVHPSERRTLTPREAARLQFFPDWFDFTGGGLEMRRGRWATMIGNAVPPKLTIELGRVLIPLLDLDG